MTLSEEYLNDAKKLISMASSHIEQDMSYEQLMYAMTFFSFGIERLLKHLLIKVNPAFILKDGNFKNAAPSLYKDKFVSSEKNSQITDTPDSDVITFRISLQRALLFSKSVNDNKQLLYSLANYRDILAHRPTSEIEEDKASRLLKRDAVILVSEICNEIHEPINAFLAANEDSLMLLSKHIKKEDNLVERMEALLKYHSDMWHSRENSKEFIKEANELSSSLLRDSGNDFIYEDIECPACEQNAIAKIEPDYDYDHHEQTANLVGVFVDKIRCFYCGLDITDYEELNYVDANSIIEGLYDPA